MAEKKETAEATLHNIQGVTPPKHPPRIRDRVLAILEGRKPDRLPFIDRLEIWYHSRMRTGTMPGAFQNKTLKDIHAYIGIGQQIFLAPYALRLHGVEVVYRFEGDLLHRELDPELENFPAQSYPKYLALDKPGITTMEFITPAGKLNQAYEVSAQAYQMGINPYLIEHLIKDEADYKTTEYILERVEYVPRYDRILAAEAELGEIGYVVPLIHRIPFQQLLLEYIGDLNLFYALYDRPLLIQRLMTVLDQRMTEIFHQLAESPFPYIQHSDNLHGLMTNPKLFEAYCLPYYQRYAEIMHHSKKKLGSHTDGDVKPLLKLLAESGLDVCESFAPAPLTACTFEEAWDAWEDGPLIWGGIPSLILEEQTPEGAFRAYIDQMLETIGNRPIILGVSDMVLGHNLIERVQYIAEKIESHVIE